MSTTPARRAFGNELTNSPGFAKVDGLASTPRAFAKTPPAALHATPTPRAGGGDGMPMSTPTPTLTPRAQSLITAQRALASPLRAAISPKASSGVKSSVKASDAATTRDVARLRELNSMLLKQLSGARTAAAEAEAARETLRDAMCEELERAQAQVRVVARDAAALESAAARAKASANADADAKDGEVERLRALNARLLKEVSVARAVVRAREETGAALKESSDRATARAEALEAHIESKQKTLERVQVALASATERAADSLRAKVMVDKLRELNAVLVGEIATLRDGAEADAETLRAQIAEKSAELDGVKASLQAAQAEALSLEGAREDVHKLRELNAVFMTQIKSLRAKADESLDISANLQAKERELALNEIELKRATEAHGAAQEDVQRLRSLNNMLIEQVSSLKDSVEIAREEKSAELAAAKMALELVEAELERSSTDVSKLRELNSVILAQMRTLKTASMEDRAAFKAEIDGKSAELAAAIAALAELERTETSNAQELDSARAHIAVLNGQLSTLKQIAEENLAINAHLSGQIEAKKLEIADVKETLAAAEAKAAKFEVAESNVRNLRELNSVLIGQLATLKTVEAENESLSKALTARTNELETARLALAAAEEAKAAGEAVSEGEISNLRELNTRIIQRIGEIKSQQESRFQSLIDSKSMELADVKAQLSKSLAEAQEGQMNNASLEKNMATLQSMNGDLTGQIKAMESELVTEKAMSAELRQAVASAEHESETLRAQLQSKDEELESAWGALMSVNANLKHALHDAEGMRALALKRHEQLEEANVNVGRLRELNQMMIERLHKAKKAALEADALNAEFAAARTQAEVTIREEEAKICALEQTIEAKDAEYERVTNALRTEMESGNTAAAKHLSDVQTNMYAQITSLERQLEYSQADLDKVRRSEALLIEDQKRSASEIESLVATLEKTESNAKAAAQEANAEICALQIKLVAQETQSKGLKKSLDSSKSEVNALKRKLEGASAKLKQSCADLALAAKDLQDSAEAHKAKDIKIATMRAQLKDLTNKAEEFTKLAQRNGEKANSVGVKLMASENARAEQSKRIDNLSAALKVMSEARDELTNKVAMLERKGKSAEIALRAAAESLSQTNQRCSSLEHQINAERAEFEQLQNSLTQSLTAAEYSMDANAQLIAQLEAKYQETLQILLTERAFNAEQRSEMQTELNFLSGELDVTSAELEAMIERNNRGVLVKIADSDMCRLVFGASGPASVSERTTKAVIRLGMIGAVLAAVVNNFKRAGASVPVATVTKSVFWKK